MVYVLHKFKYYLLGNKFVFYANHMTLLYFIKNLNCVRNTIRFLFPMLMNVLNIHQKDE
jgi:bacteriorhodopsin